MKLENQTKTLVYAKKSWLKCCSRIPSLGHKKKINREVNTTFVVGGIATTSYSHSLLLEQTWSLHCKPWPSKMLSYFECSSKNVSSKLRNFGNILKKVNLFRGQLQGPALCEEDVLYDQQADPCWPQAGGRILGLWWKIVAEMSGYSVWQVNVQTGVKIKTQKSL